MKQIFFALTLVLSLSSYADIDAALDKAEAPSSTELSAYRACFKELSVLGCRHPSEDQEHFRSCLRETFGSLTSGCQKMMTTLYGQQK